MHLQLEEVEDEGSSEELGIVEEWLHNVSRGILGDAQCGYLADLASRGRAAGVIKKGGFPFQTEFVRRIMGGCDQFQQELVLETFERAIKRYNNLSDEQARGLYPHLSFDCYEAYPERERAIRGFTYSATKRFFTDWLEQEQFEVMVAAGKNVM